MEKRWKRLPQVGERRGLVHARFAQPVADRERPFNARYRDHALRRARGRRAPRRLATWPARWEARAGAPDVRGLRAHEFAERTVDLALGHGEDRGERPRH